MKKIITIGVLCLGLTCLSSDFALAEYVDQANTASLVKQALKMPDNSYVKLKGSIKKRLTSDEYLFADKTGSINIEIDHDKWMGQTVKNGDLIEISGEVDREFNSIKIDVDTVRIIR